MTFSRQDSPAAGSHISCLFHLFRYEAYSGDSGDGFLVSWIAVIMEEIQNKSSSGVP
jgi:hypothetical protein